MPQKFQKKISLQKSVPKVPKVWGVGGGGRTFLEEFHNKAAFFFMGSSLRRMFFPSGDLTFPLLYHTTTWPPPGTMWAPAPPSALPRPGRRTRTVRAAMPLPPAGAAVCGPPEAGQDKVSGRLAGWCKKTKQFNLLNAQFTELCCVLWTGRVHNQKNGNIGLFG